MVLALVFQAIDEAVYLVNKVDFVHATLYV